MGRDVWQGLIRLVVLAVLPDKPLEHALVAGRRFGKAALVEEQEVGIAPDIDRGGLAPVLHSPLQRLVPLKVPRKPSAIAANAGKMIVNGNRIQIKWKQLEKLLIPSTPYSEIGS